MPPVLSVPTRDYHARNSGCGLLVWSYICAWMLFLAMPECLVAQPTANPRPAMRAPLARDGSPHATIVVGRNSSDAVRFAAGEIQRYIKLLSHATLPMDMEDRVTPGMTPILVGGPQDFPLAGSADPEAVALFRKLKPEGYVIRMMMLAGQPAILVGGNDDRGTIYAAYRLIEELGFVFQLSGDILPQTKSDLSLPFISIRHEPVTRYRGIIVDPGFCVWYMGLTDFRRFINQMPKLRLNRLELYLGIGSPWLPFTHDGTLAELTTTPESHYLAWGRDSRSWGRSPHSTTGSRADVRVGRDVFPDEFVGAPEFSAVTSPDEARRLARDMLRELIEYAHSRQVEVSLMTGELSFVPPNLAEVEPLRRSDEFMYQRYCGVALSPGNPRTLDIWESAMRALIDTYPRADGFGFWATEHSPDLRDPKTAEILRSHADLRAKLPTLAEIRRRGNVIVSKTEQLDSDFLQIYLSAELIRRVKKHHPRAKLGIMTLFRGYELAVLDLMVPKDVWLGNLEQCATTGPVMDFYSGIKDRELIVVPRITDDGSELHLQLNAMEYEQDEIIKGAAKYNLAGVMGQLMHDRNAEYNVRYLAEGMWDASITPRSFYERHLLNLFGSDAAPLLLQAFQTLEENEKAMVYWGRSEIFRNFSDFSPLAQLRTNVNYRDKVPTVNIQGGERINVAEDQRAAAGTTRKLEREELVRAMNATWGDGPFWKWRQAIASQHAAAIKGTEGEHYQNRAAQCRDALAILRKARPRALPGSRAELEYVIYKTENLIGYFDTLTACFEATVMLDRAWLGLVDQDPVEFRVRLGECSEILARAERLAHENAAEMIGWADIPSERHLLMRYNRTVIGSIEKSRKYVADIIAFQRDRPLDGTVTK